jgi:hypothetical protein
LIFERYLVLASLPALQRELRESGTLTRIRKLATGKAIGGVPLTNGPLAYILRNRVYLGELNHRGKSYPGAHEAIIHADVFEAVQTQSSPRIGTVFVNADLIRMPCFWAAFLTIVATG